MPVPALPCGHITTRRPGHPATVVRLLALLATLGAGYAGAAPSVYPTGVTVHDPARAYPGYTLFRAGTPGTIYAIDMAGNVVNTWENPLGSRMGPLAKPLPNGHILSEMGSEMERFVVEMDWDGNIVWEYRPPDPGWRVNHDFERLPSGNTLILTYSQESVPSVAPREMNEERIFEVTPAGEIVWMWRTSDHYAELDLSPEGRQMIYDGTAPYEKSDLSVFHTNAVQSLPANPSGKLDRRFREGNILVSQRNTNQVFVIDKATGAIVWNLRQCFPEGGGTIGQHHAKLIPNNLQGAGNVLVFDNGGHAGYPPEARFNSRVLEVNPLTCQVVWQYTDTFRRDPVSGLKVPQLLRSFFSKARSSAQRLPSGNTLIAEAEWQRIFEVTREGDIVWEYVYPYPPSAEPPYQLFIYRAYRTDFGWPAGEVGPGKFPKRFVW